MPQPIKIPGHGLNLPALETVPFMDKGDLIKYLELLYEQKLICAYRVLWSPFFPSWYHDTEGVWVNEHAKEKCGSESAVRSGLEPDAKDLADDSVMFRVRCYLPQKLIGANNSVVHLTTVSTRFKTMATNFASLLYDSGVIAGWQLMADTEELPMVTADKPGADDYGLFHPTQTSGDMHLDTASRIYSLHPDRISEEQRRVAKFINFSSLYK